MSPRQKALNEYFHLMSLETLGTTTNWSLHLAALILALQTEWNLSDEEIKTGKAYEC